MARICIAIGTGAIGGVAALALAAFIVSEHFDWRLAY